MNTLVIPNIDLNKELSKCNSMEDIVGKNGLTLVFEVFLIFLTIPTVRHKKSFGEVSSHIHIFSSSLLMTSSSYVEK
jgi:hypothetical protein